MSRFAQLAFTDPVGEVQAEQGSAAAMARMLDDVPLDALGPAESAFLAERDGVYLATVGATGWPYVQHRGGPPGFLHVLDEHTVGFVDVRGNRAVHLHRQPAPRRPGGRVRDGPRPPAAAQAARAGRGRGAGRRRRPHRPALRRHRGRRPERLVLIHVEGVQPNCPQHITPRWSAADLTDVIRPLRERIVELEAQVARLT